MMPIPVTVTRGPVSFTGMLVGFVACPMTNGRGILSSTTYGVVLTDNGRFQLAGLDSLEAR